MLPKCMLCSSAKRECVFQLCHSNYKNINSLIQQGIHSKIHARTQVPIVDVKWNLKRNNDENTTWRLRKDTEYEMNVKLRLVSGTCRASPLTKSFHKTKTVGWWLVIGYDDELLALKRIHGIGPKGSTTSLTFEAPEVPSGRQFQMKLFLVSDAIIGLDQEYGIDFEVVNEDSSNGASENEDSFEGSDDDEDDEDDGFWDSGVESEDVSDDEEEGFWDD